jgi:uncharacterized delta-60 repeat protein
MQPRRPARASGVQKILFNPLRARRFQQSLPAGITSVRIPGEITDHVDSIETASAPALVLIPHPVPAKLLVRGQSGIPASQYHAAYEQAFQNQLTTLAEEAVTSAALIETLMRGNALRQRMLETASLAETDTDSALLCLRHLLDVQLCLSALLEAPKNIEALVYIQKSATELQALQQELTERELKFTMPSTGKPTLQLALTHLVLGAASLNLIKLQDKYPQAFPRAASAGDLGSTNFSNPLHQARATAPRHQSVLATLSQAAYDYLAQQGTTPAWLRQLQSTDWINEALQSAGDPSDHEDLSPLEYLIQHTEILRKTCQEPIEIDLIKLAAYLAAGAAVALFMKYQVPSPFAAENINTLDNTLNFFAPPQGQDAPDVVVLANATLSLSTSLSETLTSTQTQTHSQSQTASQSGSQSQSTSQTLSGSQTQSTSKTQSASQTLSRSQTQSTSQTQSASQTQTASQALSSSQTQSRSQGHTPSLTQSVSQTQMTSPTPSQTLSPSPALPNCNAAVGDFWVETLGGTGSNLGSSLAIAPDGSLVLTGVTTSFGAGGNDALLAKFQANGSLAWVQTLGGTGDDQSLSLAVAPDGSIVLTGYTRSFSIGIIDVLLAKFQTNGSLAWAKTLGGVNGDAGQSLAIAPDGSIVLTGYTASSGAGSNDVLLAKFQANGNLAWVQTIGGTGDDRGNSLAIAPDGNLILTGWTTSFGTGNQHVLIAKFQANGNLIWAQILAGTGVEQGNSLAIAPDGSLILTGWTDSFGAGSADVLLAKFQANGNLAWAQTLGGINDDRGSSLAIAADGSLILIGSTVSFGTGFTDVLLAKYQANGSLTWAKTLGGGATDIYGGSSLAITPNSSLALTGSTSSLGGGSTYALLAQLSSEGTFPFSNPLIQSITTAQVQFTNPTIIDITSSLSIASWGASPRAWTTVSVSSINPSLQNLNCAGSASTTFLATSTGSITISPTATPSKTATQAETIYPLIQNIPASVCSGVCKPLAGISTTSSQTISSLVISLTGGPSAAIVTLPAGCISGGIPSLRTVTCANVTPENLATIGNTLRTGGTTFPVTLKATYADGYQATYTIATRRQLAILEQGKTTVEITAGAPVKTGERLVIALTEEINPHLAGDRCLKSTEASQLSFPRTLQPLFAPGEYEKPAVMAAASTNPSSPTARRRLALEAKAPFTHRRNGEHFAGLFSAAPEPSRASEYLEPVAKSSSSSLELSLASGLGLAAIALMGFIIFYFMRRLKTPAPSTKKANLHAYSATFLFKTPDEAAHKNQKDSKLAQH